MPLGRVGGDGAEEFESLYLTLPSNGGGAQFADTNRNNDYKIKLPYRLHLPGNGWQVALSSITLPRRTTPSKVDKSTLLKRIPADEKLMSIQMILFDGSAYVYQRTEWVTMGEVLNHESVYDGKTFMKRLKLLLERNMYAMFYGTTSKNGGMGISLRKTRTEGGTDTGVRGYPDLKWNEEEEYLEIDWSNTPRTNQLELSVQRKFGELIGCVSWHDGAAVNAWHYGPNLILYPRDNGPVTTDPSISGPTSPDAIGPIYYNNSPNFFGFRSHARYRFINANDWFTAESRSLDDSMVYVYSNAGRGTILGGQITDLLRQVPVGHKDEEGFVYYEPKNMQHIDVRNTELDVLEIAIGNPEGGLAELGTGITTTTLHFRRVP